MTGHGHTVEALPIALPLCLAEMSSAESGGIVSRPNLNFEPAFDQELLSMAHTCLRAEPLDSHAPYVEGAHIYKDGRKGRRTRPPYRNGDVIRPGDHENTRAQSSRSDFCTPVFLFPVQDACGRRDGRRRTRKGDASDAAR